MQLFPLLLGGTNKLQELYYYGYTEMAWNVENFAVDMLSVVDGYFKTVTVKLNTIINYSSQDNFFFTAVSLTDDKTSYPVAGSTDGWQDYFSIGDLSADATYSLLGANEMMSMVQHIEEKSERISIMSQRIARIMMANDEFRIRFGIRNALGATLSAGSTNFQFDLMQVINPTVFNFSDGKSTGLKFVWLTRYVSETKKGMSSEFPCAGYLTNMSAYVTNFDGGNQTPTFLSWTIQDTDYLDNFSIADDGFDIRGGAKGTATFEIMDSADNSNNKYQFHYKHWGTQYIKMTGRTMLNQLMRSAVSANFFTFFTADFVPFKNAIWSQIYVSTVHSETGTNSALGWKFPIDINNCQIHVVAKITAGSGVLKGSVIDHKVDMISDVSNAQGDVKDDTPLSDRGLSSAGNLGALIPLSATQGAQNPVVQLGNVRGGQSFVWDFLSVATITGVLYFVITGRVGAKYYSKNNKFVAGPSLLNYGGVLPVAF